MGYKSQIGRQMEGWMAEPRWIWLESGWSWWMCEWTCVRQMDGWMGVDGVQMDGQMVGQTDEQMRAWSPAGWIWMWVWVPDGLEVKDGMCGQLMEGDGSPG